MAIDTERIKKSIREILIALGDDPDREGLKDTPDRVARMYQEVFEGMNYSNRQIADMFDKTFEENLSDRTNNDLKDNKYETTVNNDLVIVRDIEVFSYCEHHLALMYDMKVTVAYIPDKKVIGLSKIARIADMVAKRLQLQERIGMDIAEIMEMVTDSPDIAVLIEATHSCMTARGIRNTSARTYTQTLRGRFKTDHELLMRLQIK